MKTKQKPTNKEGGITLIALIITIIVLVILAAVSISAVYNSNIIGYAINGALNYAEETNRENEILGQTESIIQSAVNKINDIVGGGSSENPGGDDGDEGENPETPPEEPDTGINFGDLTDDEKSAMVGKYVDYVPVSGTFSDHVGETYSGVTDNRNTQLSTITTLKWRILGVNENILTLISDVSANNNFGLAGANGYNNGVLLLNNACKAMYSNSSLGATARSANIDDIEDYMTYDKTNYSTGEQYGTYGNEYTPMARNYPSIFANEIMGAPNGTYGNNYDLSDQDEYITGTAILTGNSLFMGKQTYYSFTMSTSTMNNQTYVELFNDSYSYWLASRCVEYYAPSSYFYFDMFFVSGETISNEWLFYSYDSAGAWNLAIRPVVEIDLSKVNIGLTGDGEANTPFSIEEK